MGKYIFIVIGSILALLLISPKYLLADVDPIIGDGVLEPGQDFDYKIINIGDSPDDPAQNALIFSNTDPTEGSNPYPTTAVSCEQYIKVVFSSNLVDGRLVIYSDNRAPDADPQFTGRRTEDSDPNDPDDYFYATTDEEEYEHPYNAGDNDGGMGFVDGKRPIPITGGMVGEYEDPVDPDKNYHDEVIPIVWQVYKYWHGADNPDSEDPDDVVYPYEWRVYDYYGDPKEPDASSSKEKQYRNPTDWWGFVVDRFVLDWDWAIDWDPGTEEEPNPNYGHFKIDTDPEVGDPNNHYWLSTIGYRTIIDSYGNLGGFPGKRVTQGAYTGYRLDEDGNPIDVDEDGKPLDPDSIPAMRVAKPIEQPDGTSAYEVFIYLGANLYKRSAQGYSTSKLILRLESKENPELSVEHSIPAVAIYESGKTFDVEIKARYNGETTDRLVFAKNPDGSNPSETTNVSCRQYLEVTTKTNIRDSRVVFYSDNTYNDTFPQFTGRRTKKVSNFDATTEEELYVHPYPDAKHDLTEDEQKAGGEASIVDKLMPIPVTGGLVRWPTYSDPHEWGTDEVTPVVWRGYDEEMVGAEYPEYIYSEPTSEEATKQWAFLMEKFSFDWDWAIAWKDEPENPEDENYDGYPDKAGHFDIDLEDGDPENNYWLPTIGYRTIFDSWGNLGSFPPIDDKGEPLEEGQMRSGESPIYVYLGANFKGKHAGTYKTERIILSFE